MDSLLNIENWLTLGALILLQAVLGFDNLLYISLEAKRAPADKQAMVRRTGITLAIVLRIVLLLGLIVLIDSFKEPMFGINYGDYIQSSFNLHAIIVLVGGVFIIYTATKEVMHMMSLEDDHGDDDKPKPVWSIIFWITLMNLVFSFDSILSTMALTEVIWVMATAIILSGVMMIWLSDHVSEFLEKNRMYEVLGLFILFVVGIMLLSEGGHLAHLELFGNPVEAMSKTTFYFVIGVLVLTDIVQSRYQKKIHLAKQRHAAKNLRDKV